MNYTLDNNTSVTKVKAAAKADMINLLIETLVEKFGEDAVGMVRTVSPAGAGTNEIGVVVGNVDKGGETLPLVLTINATVKEFENRSTAKKAYTAYDFAAARQCYDNYISDKADKDADKAKKKAEKIEKDTAARKEKAEDSALNAEVNLEDTGF
jgi:hypothetical protein